MSAVIPIEEAIKRAAVTAAVEDPRPTIRIREELNAVTDEAINAVELAGLGVYVRGGMLVMVRRDGSSRGRWLRRSPGSPAIAPIDSARMLGLLDDAAVWTKFNAKAKADVPARPPEWVASQILARPEWPFPYLDAVIETPTLKRDGSVLDVPGWDEDTGLLYEPMPGTTWPAVPNRPTAKQVREALDLILDPIQDFPFVADSDRSAVVAAILTLIVRHMIDGPVPMFVVRAPTPGTGKSLLVIVIGMAGIGRELSAMTMTYDGEELRKRITSLAVDGTPAVLIDNLSGSLGADALAAALTATSWEDRILGSTQMVRVPLRTVWLATGNNVGFRRTLGRRVVPIDLDAGVEVPEDRTGFRYANLPQHVRGQRPRLVAAALTVLRGFHLAGHPAHGGTRMGSFEAWDDLVRSCVIWAGLEDPAGTGEGGGRGRIRASADDDTERLGALLEELARAYPSAEAFATAKAIQRADHDLDLRAALDAAAASPKAGSGGRATTASLGAVLRESRGRPVGGLVLHRHGRTWSVQSQGDQ